MADMLVTAAIKPAAAIILHTVIAMRPVVRRMARGIMPLIEVTATTVAAVMPPTADIAARTSITSLEDITARATRRIGMADEVTAITLPVTTDMVAGIKCTRVAVGIAARTTSVTAIAARRDLRWPEDMAAGRRGAVRTVTPGIGRRIRRIGLDRKCRGDVEAAIR